MKALESRIHPENPEPKPHPLLLADDFQRLIDAGVVNSRAEIARRYGISRARVTQIVSLLKLRPANQNHLLGLPPRETSRVLGTAPARDRRYSFSEGAV